MKKNPSFKPLSSLTSSVDFKPHILLVYPSCEPDNPSRDTDFSTDLRNLPIGILSIGTFLSHNGFAVSIIDCRRYSKEDVMINLRNSITSHTIAVGFSVMTMQVGHGLHLIDYIKKSYSLPIVVGGIHATLFPQQVIADKNIDYAIQGEGEYAALALFKYLSNQESIEHIYSVPGLCFKQHHKHIVNAVGPPLDVALLPFPDYNLLDNIEEYIVRDFVNANGSSFKTRTLDLHTSRGCPYQCTFCINTLPSFKKWRSKNLGAILEHIDFVITHYNLDFIWFMDDFFFGDLKRVKAIAEHIIAKKYNIKWEATIRANLFSETQVNDELLSLLKESGCYSLGLGFESGSDRILRKIKKAITVDRIIFAVTQCKKHNIISRGSFICGYPTETKEEVKMTGDLILRLKKIHPRGIYYSPGILRPYPGAELYAECVQYGFHEPKTLRAWGLRRLNFGLYMDPKELKWIEHPQWLQNYQIYLHLASLRLTAKLLKQKQSFAYKFFGAISLFRIKHNFFYFSIEPKLLIFARHVFAKKFRD